MTLTRSGEGELPPALVNGPGEDEIWLCVHFSAGGDQRTPIPAIHYGAADSVATMTREADPLA
jgi:hypothetical protein